MKTFPANLQTHAEGTVTSLTTCLQIELDNFEAVIDDITQADPGQVTVKYPHKLVTGNTVIMRDAGGMVEVNIPLLSSIQQLLQSVKTLLLILLTLQEAMLMKYSALLLLILLWFIVTPHTNQILVTPPAK